MAVHNYIFGAGTGETPETIAKKRRLAEALVAGARPARNVGEGLGAVGNAILYRVLAGKADAGEKSGRDAASSLIKDALFGGTPSAASTPAATNKVAKALSGEVNNTGSTADFAQAAAPGDLDGYLSNIRTAESGGNDLAKNSRSSATGRYQFTSGTWSDLADANPGLGLTPDGRTDPEQQERAIRAFTAENAKVLSGSDIPITGGNLYAAHFLGAGGAKNVLSADPTTSISALVGPEVIKANPFLNGMTVSDFSEWAAKKGGPDPINFGGTAAPAQAPVQVASLDPSAGVAAATDPDQVDPYGAIPAIDGRGEDQAAKFRQWNSDPVANEAANLQSIDPGMRQVIERAKQIAGTNFTIGSGRRDPEMQKKAVEWGWSKTEDSDHLDGGAVDLWPINDQGQVEFDREKQQRIAGAMKQAAGELGISIEAGADWKKFQDMPHFALNGLRTPMEAPIPTARPAEGGGVQVASLETPVGILPENGRPMLPNADGTVSTELSITVTDPRLNGGRPTNIPSIWGGQRLDDERAVSAALQSGERFQPFPSIDAAVAAAENRTQMLSGAVDRAQATTPQAALESMAVGQSMPMPAQTPPAAAPTATPSQMQTATQPVRTVQAQNYEPDPAIDERVRRLMEAAAHPFATEAQRAMIGMEVERLQSQNDPVRRMQLDKGRLEMEQLRNPKPTYRYMEANGDQYRIRENDPSAKPELVLDAPDDPLKVIQIKKAQLEVDAAQKGDGADFKVVDKRLIKTYKDGRVEDVTPEAPEGSAPLVDFDDVSGLRKEIQQLPAYKNIAQAAPIYRSMVETAGRDSRASDLNLVYGLGKIMDPTSVVREGEMVMVKNTASIPDWLNGAINSLNGGAALTPDTRKAIMAEAFGRMKGYQDQFAQDTDFYRGIVDRNKVNASDVIPNFSELGPWVPDPNAAAPSSATPSTASPTSTPQQPKRLRFNPATGELE